MAVNGYFQLVNTQKGFGVKCVPPKEGGENVPLSELIDYLGARSIAYDISALSKAVNAGTVQVVPLGMGECPPEQESYLLEVSEDSMTVTARFYPPSETGQRMSMEEFMADLQFKKII